MCVCVCVRSDARLGVKQAQGHLGHLQINEQNTQFG